MSGANKSLWHHCTKKRCVGPKKDDGIISLRRDVWGQ